MINNHNVMMRLLSCQSNITFGWMDSEREMLEALIKQEKTSSGHSTRKRHAQILLAIDENNDPLTHEQTAKAFNVKPLM